MKSDSDVRSSARGARTEGVVAAVRQRIASGRAPAGSRLPSVRECAKQAGVSPATVVAAYERLVACGEIRARRGAGYFVVGAVAPPPSLDLQRPDEREIDPLWVMHQSLTAPASARMPGCGWLPDDWLPHEEISRALRAEARTGPRELVRYGSPLGLPPLRALLSRKLADLDVTAPPDQILLTDSGTHALDLVCRTFVRPGDAVLVDDPCYFNFVNVVRANGGQPLGVPYTAHGPDLAQLEALASTHRPKLYLTSGVLHNPTGAMASTALQHRILKLAETHQFAVVEDDIFSDLAEVAQTRLAGVDGLERVLYVGSTSKTLSAAVRSGFIAARADWIAALSTLKLATTFGSSDLAARVVHRLLVDGSYRRHVERLKERLARRRAQTIASLQRIGIEPVIAPRGGLFVWARLPGGVSASAVARHAEAEGVLLAPGDVFSVGRRAADCMRFNVAHCAGQLGVFEGLECALTAAA